MDKANRAAIAGLLLAVGGAGQRARVCPGHRSALQTSPGNGAWTPTSGTSRRRRRSATTPGFPSTMPAACDRTRRRNRSGARRSISAGRTRRRTSGAASAARAFSRSRTRSRATSRCITSSSCGRWTGRSSWTAARIRRRMRRTAGPASRPASGSGTRSRSRPHISRTGTSGAAARRRATCTR